MKKLIILTFSLVMIFSISSTFFIDSNQNQANAASKNHYVTYQVTNKSPRGQFTYKTSDVYLTKASAKKFVSKKSLNLSSAFVNAGIGIIPGGFPSVFAASKSISDIVVPSEVNKIANKNKGVHLRFQNGNVVNMNAWNGSKKTATNSIKKMNNAYVSQTIKILKKG